MIQKELLRQRLAFIRQGSETERFHTKRAIQRNDVGHHSYHVAWLAYLMARAAGLNDQDCLMVVMAALAHDLVEHITGDMPGDAKRELNMREKFANYEKTRFIELGMDFEIMLNPEGERAVKLADMMDGAFFCIGEASLGNKRFVGVFNNFRLYMQSFTPFNECEQTIVDYIDELWKHYGAQTGGSPHWNKNAHTASSMEKEEIVGQDKDDWGDFAQRTGLGPGDWSNGMVPVLQREEAEGRATLPPGAPCQHTRAIQDISRNVVECEACGSWRYPMSSEWRSAASNPSKAVNIGDMPVTEQGRNDAMDDRAQLDLAAKESLPANARQHGGDHYKGTGYEHWDLVLDTGMNYFQGCATKYVTRARKHSKATAEENLLKAIHYVDKVSEAEKQGRTAYVEHATYSSTALADFKAANQLTEEEALAIRFIIEREWPSARASLLGLLRGLDQSKSAGQDGQWQP